MGQRYNAKDFYTKSKLAFLTFLPLIMILTPVCTNKVDWYLGIWDVYSSFTLQMIYSRIMPWFFFPLRNN